jgi:hypothetical protein
MKRNARSCRQIASGVCGAALGGLMFCAAPALAQQPGLPTTALAAGIYVIKAEVADTAASRAQGLMRRKAMDQGAGMLFVFDQTAIHCMWMKNTLIPLSVAFIDARGLRRVTARPRRIAALA